MRRFGYFTINALCLLGFGLGVSARAQQAQPVATQPVTDQPAADQPGPTQVGSAVMGAVATRDALVEGGLQVEGEFAELMSNVSVTAYDRTAPITLARGGHVLVCSTSQFHLLHSGSGKSLLFGLDRGAMEIESPSAAQDVILTPDIRFTVQSPGSFDLDLRVTPDGDTCVNNAGAGAPVLSLNESFSSASYRLLPGQHVLFEHGSLREVVDNEKFSCGCPATLPPVATASVAKTEGAHPFPEAASEGLAPETTPDNSAPAGEKHTQIAATFSYGEGQPPPPSTLPPPAPAPKAAAAPPPPPAAPPASTPSPAPALPAGQPAAGAAVSSASAAPPPAPPGAHDIGRSIGRFFHRLFHPKEKSTPPAG